MAIRRRKIFANVPISSMADIAFLLLIFFMVTSVLKVDADLPLILPDAGGEEIKEKDLQISVDRNKQFYFGNIAMGLDATVAKVQEQKSKSTVLPLHHKSYRAKSGFIRGHFSRRICQ